MSIYPLPAECCGFRDENEAFAVQFLEKGRFVCYCYGKEAFGICWIIVDTFYGSKRFIINPIDKIDDDVLLLSADSFVVRCFSGPSSVRYVSIAEEERPNGDLAAIAPICFPNDGVVQRLAALDERIFVALRVYVPEPDGTMRERTEFRLYEMGQWTRPQLRATVAGRFERVDFPDISGNRLRFFSAASARTQRIADFGQMVEINLEKEESTILAAVGLAEIFEDKIEHLAKNVSGAWFRDQFYLYTTPNPALCPLEHFFVRLNVETLHWVEFFVGPDRLRSVLELHFMISTEGMMIIDCRDKADQRTIHRIPLIEPDSLQLLCQFAVNRRFGDISAMSEEERRSVGLPPRLGIWPAFPGCSF